MQRKNDSTILILVAAGLGIYWFMKNKSNTSQVNPADQSNGGGGGAYYNPDIKVDQLDLAETGFPPNTGSNFDIVYDNPVGRGGGSVTDMIDNLFDKSRNIDNDRFYEK
jgi:hypothetical protein